MSLDSRTGALVNANMSCISPKSPVLSIAAIEARSVVRMRQSVLRRHDEPGVVCIATPDLALTMVIAVALVGFLAIDRMSRDIFPDLGVPVLYVAQPYGGMDPAQMEGIHRQLL